MGWKQQRKSFGIGRYAAGAWFTVLATVNSCLSPVLGRPPDQIRSKPFYFPPGCSVAFKLPTTALFIEADWLGDATVIRLQNLFGKNACPTTPVELKDIYFGRSVLDLLDIRNGLGEKFLNIHVEAIPGSQPKSEPGQNHRDQGIQLTQASIAMFRYASDDPAYYDPNLRDSREYEIRYGSLASENSTLVRISCNGPQGNRLCGPAPFPRFAGLIIRYDLSQNQLPIPQTVSTDPMTEPGAILQFDQRFRSLLIKLEEPS